jgi:hypothetical protein
MTSNLTTNLKRFWRSVIREPYTGDRRSRLRVVMNNLILHIHPAQVPTRALRFTYTWGLGGLSALLVVLLAVTGSMLLFHYTPSPDAAYNSILALQTGVWFGALVRNLHHWAGNLLLVVAFLHLLRVFFTDAFRPRASSTGCSASPSSSSSSSPTSPATSSPGTSSPTGASPSAPASSATSPSPAPGSPAFCSAAPKSAPQPCSTSTPCILPSFPWPCFSS